MKKAVLYSIFATTCHLFVFSQTGDTTQLEELIIESYKISSQSKSQNTFVLNDSILQNNVGTFTELLQKNTTIYFKENGYGMVSSPSFRGTTAQQTSVLWNGIKINSALLGQTDFNATAFKSYDDVIIKPGGGSVLYGSSAIGGTIHLNNHLNFNSDTKNILQLNYGSYNTQGLNYKITTGSKRFAINASFGYNASANDYEWIGQNRKNSNGAFFNTDLSVALAYKMNANNTLSFYSSTYNDDRHFSLLTPYQTKTKYLNNYNRNLLKWHYGSTNFVNILYTSNTIESYTYFDQLPTTNNSGGEAKTWYFKNESFYNIKQHTKISGIIEYQNTSGSGKNSGLPYTTQEIFAISLLGNYEITNSFGFEIGAKNEIAKDYENPFLFSTGLYYKAQKYELKINGSKNYRIPTFNDLYWQPGGNLNLKPETSFQIDINNQFNLKHLNFNISTYYTSINDMIRWVPTLNGFWEANNVDAVTIYGADVHMNFKKYWKQQAIHLKFNYGFTKSVDGITNKQLTYTPVHKYNVQLQYTYKNLSFIPSFLYVGDIYTTSTNDKESMLKGYGIIDIDLQKKFKVCNNPFIINLRIKNAANTVYTNMPERLMPGRNYHIQIIKKF